MNAKQNALLAAILANPQVIAALLGKMQSASPTKASLKKAAENAPLQSKEDRKFAFEQATIAAFKKAGFPDAIPNKDILTYGRWEALGFRVKSGEKAIRVKMKGRKGPGLPMFHKSQVEAIAGASA